VGHKIGQGGYGTVYFATHRVTGIHRAIKVIKKRRLDQENQKYILMEFESLQKLDHPNLVKLIERYEDKDHIYLV
jgi:calcium-dependent protein kinase